MPSYRSWLRRFAPYLLLGAVAAFILYLYTLNHAFGATGDDSPLYLEMASRLAEGKSLIYYHPIVKLYLGAEMAQEAQWAVPHWWYRIVDSNGLIEPTVNVGFAYLLGGVRAIFGDEAQFFVNPVLAVVTVVCLFLILELALREVVGGAWIALGGALFLAVTPDFWTQAVYQPMTEISASAFLAFAVYAGMRAPERRAWLLVAAVSLGFATSIRAPTILVGPAVFLPYLVNFIRSQSWRPMDVSRVKELATQGALPTVLIVGGLVLGFLPSIVTSLAPAVIAGEPVSSNLLTNQEHLQGLSFENYFEDSGKFRVGTGGLEHYKAVLIDRIVRIPLAEFIFLAAAVALVRRTPLFASVLLLWIGATYFFYAGWTNPYTRYALVAVPAVVAVLFAGVSSLVLLSTKRRPRVRLVALGLSVLLLVVVAVGGAMPRIQDTLSDSPSSPSKRSMTQSDWRTLRSLELPERAVVVALEGAHPYASTIAAATGGLAIMALSPATVGRQVTLLVEAGYNVVLWDDLRHPALYDEAVGNCEVVYESVFDFSFGKGRLTLLASCFT